MSRPASKQLTLVATLMFILAATIISNDTVLAKVNLDVSFANIGKLTTVIGEIDNAYDLAIQPDGKIILAGGSFNQSYNIAVVRYTNEGILDAGFGNQGIVTTSISPDSDFAQSTAIQRDGKIVVAGSSGDRFDRNIMLARYNTNGNLDHSFGNSGVVITSLGTISRITDIAIQSDGKIVAAGNIDINYGDIVIARYLVNGSLDPSFGNNGIVIADQGQNYDLALGITLDSKENILVAGRSGSKMAIWRFLSAGQLDSSFANNGWLTANIDSNSTYEVEAEAIAIQPDGKILVAGTSCCDYTAFLARFEETGAVDFSFATTGFIHISTSPHMSFGKAVVVQTDGKIVVAGRSGANDNTTDFLLARFNNDGSLDADLGIITTDINKQADRGEAVAILPSGDIIVGGISNSHFALARYRDYPYSLFLPALAKTGQ